MLGVGGGSGAWQQASVGQRSNELTGDRGRGTGDIFTCSNSILSSLLQRSVGVLVETGSAPDPTCAPAPTDRSLRPADPSQVIKLLPSGVRGQLAAGPQIPQPCQNVALDEELVALTSPQQAGPKMFCKVELDPDPAGLGTG